MVDTGKLVKTIERKYNVTILYDQEKYKNNKLTVKFDHDETIEDVYKRQPLATPSFRPDNALSQITKRVKRSYPQNEKCKAIRTPPLLTFGLSRYL